MALMPAIKTLLAWLSGKNKIYPQSNEPPVYNGKDVLAPFQERRLDLGTVPSCRQYSGLSHGAAPDLTSGPELLLSINEEGVLIFIIVEIDERGSPHIKKLKTNVLITDSDASSFIRQLMEYSNVVIDSELSRWLKQEGGSADNQPLSDVEDSEQAEVSIRPVWSFLGAVSNGLSFGKCSVVQRPLTGNSRPLLFLFDEDYHEDSIQRQISASHNGFQSSQRAEERQFNSLNEYIEYINRQLEVESVTLKSLFGDISYFLQNDINYIEADEQKRLSFKQHINFIQSALTVVHEEDLSQVIKAHLQESEAYSTAVQNLWWWVVSAFEQSGRARAAEEYMRGLLEICPYNRDLFRALVWHLVRKKEVEQAEVLINEWSKKAHISKRFIKDVRQMLREKIIRKLQDQSYSNFRPFSDRFRKKPL